MSPGRTRTGDFNGDGITDLANVHYAVNNGQATWPLTVNLSTGPGFTISDPQYISYATGTPFLWPTSPATAGRT